MKILLFAHRLQLGHLDNLKEKLSNVEAKISQVQPVEDQLLFIEHNIRPFTLPDDWKYEPCTLHYDTVNKLSLLLSLCGTITGYYQSRML